MATEMLQSPSSKFPMENQRPLKRKLKAPQAPLACEGCRAKKVRCDLIDRQTRCSRCEKSGIECNIVPGKRRHLVRRVFGSTAGSSPAEVVGSYRPPYTAYSSSDVSSPSMSSESAHSPFSVMSWESHASSATSVDATDAFYCPQLIVEQDTDISMALPAYIEAAITALSPATYDNLQLGGCFDMPDAETWMDLVESYLKWVQPTLPMIDIGQLRALASPEPFGTPISLLLMKAVEMVARLSSSQDSMDGNDLARQVEAMLRARVETEPLPVLQSLVLMSFNDSGSSESKDGYHWIGVACRYASKLLASGRITSWEDEPTRQTLRCLLMRDAVLALGARKPRQAAPDISSFISCSDVDLSWLLPSISGHQYLDSSDDSQIWQALQDISEAMTTTVDAKISQTASFDEAARLLAHWYHKWYSILESHPSTPSLPVHRSVLFSYWSLAILTLHCWNTAPSQIRSQPTSPSTHTTQTSTLITRALDLATSTNTHLLTHSLLQHLPATAICALAPVAVAHLVNSTSPDSKLRVEHTEQYYSCWQVLRELRGKYRTAGRVMRMLDGVGQGVRKEIDGDAGRGDMAEELRRRLAVWS